MKPLKAVVTKIAETHMRIELRSGTTFNIQKVSGIGRGAMVDVYYDFTKNLVRGVRLSGERDVPIFGEAPEEENVDELVKQLNFEDIEEGVEKEVGAPSEPEIEEVLEIEEWEKEQELLETGASSHPGSKQFH